MGLIFLILLLILLFGMAPAWPSSRPWGYRPVSTAGLLLIILLLLAFQVVPWWGPPAHY